MDLTKIQKSEKVIDISKQVILIYGRAKIGKSTFCSHFEKPLFLATEPGLNNLEVHKVNINSWEVFLDACKSITDGKHDFKTIVIDTIDNLVVFCSAYICSQHNINHPADLPHGKGWSFVTTELTRVISKLTMFGYGIIFTSHCELEEIETKTRKYNRWTISLSGKNRGIFLNLADIILFVDSEMDKDGNEKRLIRTKPSMYWEAGDRLAKLPPEIPLDFKEFEKHFKTGKEAK